MEIYLVGGAVRDQLLNLPIQEKDWVVVGSNVDEMLKQGYRKVGKDFPVFLHPETKEEYALARTERKVGRGYSGFDFNASSSVTLEDDLKRRDLTINAIAQNAAGEYIDPFHGREDIEKRILRHVSSAFIEDPVRLLRIARFAARFADLGFTVAPETMHLLKDMVRNGEINYLVAERVWKELEKALQEKRPEVFFNVLAQCNALPVLFPHLQPNGITALEKARELSSDPEIRFAALLYRLNFQDITAICEHFRIPSSYRELALMVARRYRDYLHAKKAKPDQLLTMFQNTDAYRREARFIKFLETCEAIALAENKESQNGWLLNVFNASKSVEIHSILNSNKVGKDIGELISQKRLDSIVKFVKQAKKIL